MSVSFCSKSPWFPETLKYYILTVMHFQYMVLYHFGINFQAISIHITILEIWRVQYVYDYDLLQYDISHCHVANVHCENCPNFDFWLPSVFDCFRKFPVYDDDIETLI